MPEGPFVAYAPTASSPAPDRIAQTVSSTAEPVPETIADDKDHSLDPASIPLERIGSFIGTAILGLVLFGATVGGSLAAGRFWFIFFGAYATIMLLLCLRSWFWPPLAYRHTSYRLSRRGLVIRRGVIWRSVAHVPRSRVQHTDVSQGPLQRYFDLGTLTVHTAGTEFASIALEGLNREVADQIRDVLIDAGEGDGV